MIAFKPEEFPSGEKNGNSLLVHNFL